MDDPKRERFLRVASARTEKILNLTRLLGNCTNTSNYSYTEEEVNHIFKSIREELDIQETKFRMKLKEDSGKRKRFTL